MCTTCVAGAHGGQKRVSDPPGTGVTVLEIEPRSSARTANTLNYSVVDNKIAQSVAQSQACGCAASSFLGTHSSCY